MVDDPRDESVLEALLNVLPPQAKALVDRWAHWTSGPSDLDEEQLEQLVRVLYVMSLAFDDRKKWAQRAVKAFDKLAADAMALEGKVHAERRRRLLELLAARPQKWGVRPNGKATGFKSFGVYARAIDPAFADTSKIAAAEKVLVDNEPSKAGRNAQGLAHTAALLSCMFGAFGDKDEKHAQRAFESAAREGKRRPRTRQKTAKKSPRRSRVASSRKRSKKN